MANYAGPTGYWPTNSLLTDYWPEFGVVIFTAIIALTLHPRSTALTLEDRDTALTLHTRSTALTMEDR